MRLQRAMVVVGVGLAALAAVPSSAHPPSILNDGQQKAVAEEIVAFRAAVASAIRTRDAAKLLDLYAPSFVHTHTSAKTDARDTRIVSALAGEPVIETAETSDLDIRVPNDWTAIATGLSPIKSMADGKIYAVRWMAVYVRIDKGWQLAASQATRSHEIK